MFDLIELFIQFEVITLIEMAQIVCKEKLVFEFTCRTTGDMYEASEFNLGIPAAAFSMIGRNGSSCAPHLAGQSIQLVLWKIRCEFVYSQGKVVRPFPDLNFLEISH